MCGTFVTIAPEEPSARPLLSQFQLAAVLALAVAAHALYWPTRPPDMALFLEPWFAHIVHFGPVRAFAHPFSNYEPAYLYLLAAISPAHGLLAPIDLIKLLSVAGSVFLTIAVANLLETLGTPRRLAVFTLILPTVVINAALLGQCDAIWGGSCVFALAAMMRGQTLRSLVWCGLAFAFKSQAAFIAPVIIGAMIGRRPPVWQWLVPAAVFLATLVPAWLLGWPLWKLLAVYPDQAALVKFPGKLANPWIAATIFADQPSRAYFPIGYAAAILAALAITALAARSFTNRRAMLLLAALSATALPFLLPKMLERYYFLGDVLALVLALSFRSRGATFTAIGVQAASVISLLTYIYWFHWPYPALLGIPSAAAAIAGIVWFLRQNSAEPINAASGWRPPASAERIAA